MSEQVIAIPDDVTSVRMVVEYYGIPAQARIMMTISATDQAVNLIVTMPVQRFEIALRAIRLRYRVEWAMGLGLFQQVYMVYPR